MATIACPTCGPAVDAVPTRDLPAALVDAGQRWVEFITIVCEHPGGPELLGTRPASGTWSALEYSCHVRDVVALTTRNVELALLVDDPELHPVDGPAMLASGVYHAHDPRAVADDLAHAAAELAGLVQRHRPADLERTGSLDGRTVRCVELCRMAHHEARHHLADARDVVS